MKELAALKRQTSGVWGQSHQKNWLAIIPIVQFTGNHYIPTYSQSFQILKANISTIV